MSSVQSGMKEKTKNRPTVRLQAKLFFFLLTILQVIWVLTLVTPLPDYFNVWIKTLVNNVSLIPTMPAYNRAEPEPGLESGPNSNPEPSPEPDPEPGPESDPEPDPMTNPSFLNKIRNNFLLPPRKSGSYNLVNSTLGHQYSENKETLPTILNILGKNKPGFFIEAGAVDGESLSNTLNLEKDYNWTGLLIEPNPAVFEKLKSKGRKAWAANVCLSDSAGAKNMTFEFHQTNPFISRKKGLTNQHDWQWKYASKKVVNVTCLPLFSMLAAINVSTVDFFSLDVEGFELPVLKKIPFDRVFIKIFLIEQNNRSDTRISVFMEENGYIEKPFVTKSQVDHLFVHSKLQTNIK